MAERGLVSMAAARRTKRQPARRPQQYVYGNVVTKPQYEPQQTEEPIRPRKVSRQVRKNRRQAMHMSPGYVIFLTIAAVSTLLICVHYVNLQAKVTERSRKISAMQEKLADMREENTTRYNAVTDNVSLEEIRKTAKEKLGMVYASDLQVIEYDKASADYVKQYEKIPEEGVLAESNKK